MTALLPAPYRWLIIASLAAALIALGYFKGVSHEAEKWDLAKAVLIAAQDKAILARVSENTAILEKQKSDNTTITKVKNEEHAAELAAIANTSRLRAGSGICGGSTTPANSPSTASSTITNSSSGLVSVDAQRDIDALIMNVEDALATGRACQAFVQDNDMAPK